MIIRNPFATEQDVVEMCEILARTPKPYILNLFELGFLPNVKIRESAKKAGIEINELDGYTMNYGHYPDDYPYLTSIMKVAQYMPKPLIFLFLYTRKIFFSRVIGNLVFSFFHTANMILRKIIIKNTTFIIVAKEIVFIPNKIVNRLNRLMRGTGV